jgi:predicted PurR-regulated permease PerM
MAMLLVLIGWLHLGTLALTALFGYFALQVFSFGRYKFLGMALYIIAVAAIGIGLIYLSRQAWITLPEIADSAIPAVVGFAEKEGVELPFTDYESLRTVALSEAQEGIAGVGRYVRAAGFQFVLLLAGLVVASSLFLSAPWGSENDAQAAHDSLYARVVRELTARAGTFFQSFSKVIGAQIVISTINTGLTAVFLILNGYPFAAVLIALTFLCGLLPIIGNLISNTLIVGVAFTLSSRAALVALVFLVVIHKLEYFLNSKIIGDRIKSPMWLTLIGLVLGEKLMGIPGMILAPVVLHYIKVEASRDHPPGV